MAINAGTVWEVRTTGDATNGGGFYNRTAGTSVDYSQQDAAQLSLTDLASTSASSWLTLTSATGGFTAAMVGNIIYIASGTNFTAGYYEITERTDTNTVTLDRACGATGDATDGVGKVGGATNHPQTIAPRVVANNTIYIAYGTYVKVGANTFVLTCSVAGGNATPIKWIGYKTTRGDNPVRDDRPIFDGDSDNSGTGDTTNILVLSVSQNFFYNFIFKRDTTLTVLSGAVLSYFYNCKFTLGGGNCFNGTTYFYSSMYYCEVCNYTGSGMSTATGSSPNIFYSYIHDNGGHGLRCSHNGCSIVAISSIFESNVGCGVSFTRILSLNSIYYNNNGASYDGILWETDPSGIGVSMIYNNIFVNNGRYGVNRSGTGKQQASMDYCCYYGNGTAGLNNVTAGVHDVTSDPLFTNGGANPPDFTLQSGSPCLHMGVPDANWAVNVGLADARY